MLSILSYNILWGRRVAEVVAWIKSSSHTFDILCFQEFPKAKIPFVKAALKPYAQAYASNVIFRGKDYGQLTVILNKQITLLDTKVVWLGTNFFEDKILRLKGERSSLVTTLVYKKKRIVLANTHLIAFALNAKKRAQLATVVEYVGSLLVKKKLPTLVLGDLNYSSLYSRKPFFCFMEKRGFTNAHLEKTHRLISLKGQQLDYIFYKHGQVKDVQITKLAFSDHFPMIFRFFLPK